MGKTFKRLEKQVQGRTGSRQRWIPPTVRIAELEKFVLELGAYLALHVANDEDDPSDHALVEAYTEFKKHLEGTVS